MVELSTEVGLFGLLLLGEAEENKAGGRNIREVKLVAKMAQLRTPASAGSTRTVRNEASLTWPGANPFGLLTNFFSQ